jgi:hypothetical protein
MGKKKKEKKRTLKEDCCEKYLKKGEHKRCRRCPCFDFPEEQRQQGFSVLGLQP